MTRPAISLPAGTFLALAAGLSAIAEIHAAGRAPLEFPVPTYTQAIRITFEDEAAARSADARIEPLYDGHARAVSCRWDDNNVESNLEMKKRLDARGIKATWYLNGPDIFYLEGADYVPVARELLEGGHSVGGHGLTHPYLSYVNRNRMFEETAGVRIAWEALLDTPVNSYAFSFINYRNAAEGNAVQADIFRTLERTGYHHLAAFWGFDRDLRTDLVVSPIVPPENAPFEVFKEAVDWILADEELAAEAPCISHSMHAWYGTPALHYGWDELERRLDYLNQFDFWQCNQNQYAAYRRQVTHGELQRAGREGNVVTYRLSRPLARFLNDPVPLTVAVTGEGPSGATPSGGPIATAR